MASEALLSSRLEALVKQGHWGINDVADLCIALLKDYCRERKETDYQTWMATLLYKLEIHQISSSDLLLPSNANQYEGGLDKEIISMAERTAEKTFTEIIEEIKKQIDVDPTILHQVKKLLPVDSQQPFEKHLQDKREILRNLCKAVEKTKKWKPRQTQMVSWCIMVLSQSSRLLQIGTGEGKSCIVAMFAAYRALNNETVDIISSSPVLAERDAEDWADFYKELGITVAVNTNKKKVSELRKCYGCQVVYGTTQSFSGDWLRQRFQRENIRPNRDSHCAIIDEVDSLMLDKGLEIVYLNSPMPVMEPLNVILAEIWFHVNQEENVDVGKILDLMRSHQSLQRETDHDETTVPGFRDHMNSRLQIWIENAVHAKTMTLGHEYIRHEDAVVPVDYKSTGVVQNNMQWGDGLQQFLQMKHLTKLSNMDIITNFKSNVSLFKSYKQIFGLTGTLGNKAELDMLQKLYPGIRTCKIPSFKKRKLYEEEGIIVTDENEWEETICQAVNETVTKTNYRGPRAVLVICETIKRALMIHDALQKIIPSDKLKLYTNNNMDNSKVTGGLVTEGCVIVATNLAGRGTDLKVSESVNASGGLFVVQTFMPLNVRVEQQGFGRTAREGTPGSAQLIMCLSHFSDSLQLLMALNSLYSGLSDLLKRLTSAVLTSGFEERFREAVDNCLENPSEKNCSEVRSALTHLLKNKTSTGLTNVDMLKEKRDLFVQERLNGLVDEDVSKIIQKEELFSDYLDTLNGIYSEGGPNGNSIEDIVSSLHECWGMWLLMIFDENAPTASSKQQLRKYLDAARKKMDQKQSPSSMIYYYMRCGNTLRDKGLHAESIKMYTSAIETDSGWPAIALYNRALSVLTKGDQEHVADAVRDLKKALEAVNTYKEMLEKIQTYVKNTCENPDDFTNPLLKKQFRVKNFVQDILKVNIQQAINVLQDAERRGGVVKVSKLPLHYILVTSNLTNHILTILLGIKDVIKEIIHLESLGLDTVFTLEAEFSFFSHVRNFFSG